MSTEKQRAWYDGQKARAEARFLRLADEIAATGDRGMTWAQIEGAGWPARQAAKRMPMLVKAGLVWRLQLVDKRSGVRVQHFFGTKEQRDARKPQAQAKARVELYALSPGKQRPADVREVVGMDTAPVTICPPCQLDRYAFVPPPGWVGQITLDWQATRQARAT